MLPRWHTTLAHIPAPTHPPTHRTYIMADGSRRSLRSKGPLASFPPPEAVPLPLSILSQLDNKFAFVDEATRLDALTAQPGESPLKPQLTIAVDIGNGETGFAFHLDGAALGQGQAAPVLSRAAMTAALTQVFTRDFHGTATNAGNIPKEETLVAIERWAAARARKDAEALESGILVADADIADHRLVKIGKEARDLFDGRQNK